MSSLCTEALEGRMVSMTAERLAGERLGERTTM